MIVTSLAIAGAGALGYSVKVYREEKRKREFPWTVAAERFRRHPSSRFNREAVTKKKKRFSLHDKIKSFSETLPLDDLVPILRQTESPIVAHFSPWEETEESEIALSAKSANQEGFTTGEDWARFQRHISKYWRPYWGVGLFSSACLISFGLYETTFAYALKVIVDGVTTGKGLALVTPILGKLLIAFPVVALTAIAGERIVARLGSRVVQDIHYDIFEHLQNLSLSFYKEAKLGDILARFSSDMFYVRVGMGTEFIPAVADVLLIGINIAFLSWLSWQMTLINLLSLPLMVYVLQEFSPRTSETTFVMRNQEALMINAVREGVGAQAMIKSFSIKQFIQDSFSAELDKLEGVTTEALFARTVFDRASAISLFLSQLLSVSAGLLLLGGTYISVGTFMSFMIIQNILYQNMQKLFRHRLELLIVATAALRRIDLLFQNQVQIADAADAIQLPAFRQAIRFEKVSFGYTTSAYQLNEVDFSIKKGQFVAFVGPSGAGKSTIFNLLLRFYEVCEGRVTIDGEDVRDVTQASLRQQMGVVLQETFIFNTTILNNIRLVKPDATKAEVIKAAQAAELHDFIMRQPNGYQTNAGEGGARLSGGQKQRIAIARAMLRNPAILILDEATSSLDAETSAAIDATIHELSQKCTVISISHQLRTVTKADQILVLDQGRIVEQGSHQNLLAQDGLYAQLWHTQLGSTAA